MEKFGKFCLTIIAGFLLAMMSGWIFSKMWLWFIVSTFQARELSIAESIGVCLIVGYTAKNRDKKKKNEQTFEEMMWEWLESAFVGLAVLGMAWIVKQFM